MKFLTAAIASLPFFLMMPSHAVSQSACLAQQGKSISAIKAALGPGKLTSASAATQYTPAIQSYRFGSYQTSICTVIVQGGRATFVNFVD